MGDIQAETLYGRVLSPAKILAVVARVRVNSRAVNENVKQFVPGGLTPIHIQQKQLLKHPRFWDMLAESYVKTINDSGIEFDVLGALDTASPASQFAVLVAVKIGKPLAIFHEQEQEDLSKRQWIELMGKNIFLIDDFVATGSHMWSVKLKSRRIGFNIVGVGALGSYRFPKTEERIRKMGITLHVVTELDEIWEAFKELQSSEFATKTFSKTEKDRREMWMEKRKFVDHWFNNRSILRSW